MLSFVSLIQATRVDVFQLCTLRSGVVIPSLKCVGKFKGVVVTGLRCVKFSFGSFCVRKSHSDARPRFFFSFLRRNSLYTLFPSIDLTSTAVFRISAKCCKEGFKPKCPRCCLFLHAPFQFLSIISLSPIRCHCPDSYFLRPMSS